jgi:HSP20 family molecular chaperone IbpA
MSRNYTNIFDIFDEIWSDTWSVIQPSRFNRAIASSDWPPTNCVIDQETKNLKFEVALAGVKEDEINLSFDGDYLRLIVDRKTGDKSLKEGETKSDYVVQRGFKSVDHAEVSWTIDPRYYDRDGVDVTFENGLLTVIIYPRSEVAPKKVNLFGNLTDKKPAIAEKAAE